MSPVENTLALDAIGRVPLPGDNAAIAIRDIEAGTRFRYEGGEHSLPNTILEGHRFAVAPIKAGEYLTSWNQPFGRALRSIQPGEYLCNAGVLDALRLRNLSFALPPIPNFQNAAAQVQLEGRQNYRSQVPLHDIPRTFLGVDRGARGVGTRNHIVILGTTSSAASFVRMLAAKVKHEADDLHNIDGIVAIAHTEGSGENPANNHELVLRTLAGFLVHPNVAAVLAVDLGNEQINNQQLQKYLLEQRYSTESVVHRFYTLRQDIGQSLQECAELLRGMYATANAATRTEQPMSALRIGLQCGGSDAFSGISANPLAGWVAKEVIRNGGAANIAETDELIGAEGYMLANVRDEATARSFLDKLKVFAERISWHGHSAEGNPTAGNQYRGLYNISLKSIGAARKKDPDLRLDHVIDYAKPMTEPGFYFMDSPGNDLESVAGQVGAGCNMIFFTTGNGSITNFPFVPTVKFLTTTRRWNLLSQDMDINAGRYQDGEAMEALGREAFEYVVRVASGTPSVGERAGHSQVSIWRDWQQTDGSKLRFFSTRAAPDGKPMPLNIPEHVGGVRIAVPAEHNVSLIVPTSLCAGQIALQIAAQLNDMPTQTASTRFLALPHTEGCGSSAGENEEHLLRTMIGHLMHPRVSHALLLEHGCERTHNDLMTRTLARHGVDPKRFGYASIQLDGGIEKVTAKVKDWFVSRPNIEQSTAEPQAASLGLLSVGEVPVESAHALARVALQVLLGGASVVLPRSASLLRNSAFLSALGISKIEKDTLSYAEIAAQPGLHVMATPTQHVVEAITGLGATGVGLILAHVEGYPIQGHPMIPTLQIATGAAADFDAAADLDLLLSRSALTEASRGALINLLSDTGNELYAPRAWARGNHDFQVTRGHLGVSL
jgi:altronate dehydratase